MDLNHNPLAAEPMRTRIPALRMRGTLTASGVDDGGCYVDGEGSRGDASLDVEGESLALGQSRLLPRIDAKAAVVAMPGNVEVVATRIRNQEPIFVPGEDAGKPEILVTVEHGNGWRTTRRSTVLVDPALCRWLQGWQPDPWRNATNAEDRSQGALP